MNRNFLCFALAAALSLALRANETQTLTFELDPGTVARTSVPVCIPVSVAPALLEKSTVSIAGLGAAPLIGQLLPAGLNAPPGTNAELVFIAPKLDAGARATVTATLTAGAQPAGEVFTWAEVPGDHEELSFGARKVLRYWSKTYDASTPEKRNETYKVFHQLYDPAGKRLVNKGPGGKFTHHRGLFYGFNKVTYGGTNNVDIWHCKGAFQSHDKTLLRAGGPVAARQLVRINWNGKDDKPFATEDREYTVFNTPGGTLLQFSSRVTPVSGEIKVAGDPQHAGFHFRAALEVETQTEKETYYIRADGVGKPGETRNWSAKSPDKTVNLPWNAMSFVLDGTRYTAGYLDHPANPKEGRYSERTYGRFGSYFETAFTPEKPLQVNYRIWLQEGAATVDALAALDADFDSPVKSAPK